MRRALPACIKEGCRGYSSLSADGRDGERGAMNTIRCGMFSVALVWLVAVAFASAQITFSRDWTGGKRSAPQLAIDCGQFTRLCRHFVHDLKQAMSSELPSKRRREEADKSPPVYDDDK